VPLRRTSIPDGELDAELTALRSELSLPTEFPADALAEADAVAARALPTGPVDATDVPLVTLDRPDGRVPLHPPVLSEGAASLLPGQPRPAVLWRFDLDADGEPTTTQVRRAVVRSRAQLDYPSFEQNGGELVELLRAVGELRQQRERDRGGVSLPIPEQSVVRDGDGWRLVFRAPLPVEGWNAQLSLLTGMAAAKLMLSHGVGLLRVLPPPDERTINALRRSARALGVEWPNDAAYADVVRGLDASVPAQAAVIRVAQTLFRGAGYVAFDGTQLPAPGPADAMQSAVAAPYAHATAPLRRLADRFVSECCLAACAGSEVPAWVRSALPSLPDLMSGADRKAHEVDRMVVDLAEALVLQGHRGETFCGVVTEAEQGRGVVQLREPAVRARIEGADIPVGEEVDVRLSDVDVGKRRVAFTPV
jgi:exoribonuclease R